MGVGTIRLANPRRFRAKRAALSTTGKMGGYTT